MQMAFYYDQTRCSRCYTCVVSCKDWYDTPAGPSNWLRIKPIEEGKYPHPFWANIFSPCYHCVDPACVPACPVNAISKREQDGIVVVDRELCLGKDTCQLCLDACSYDAPQFGAEENAKMEKCGFCLERWEEGKKPICVAACPMRALDAGPIDEMKAKYGDVKEAAGFNYNNALKPSIIFKAKTR